MTHSSISTACALQLVMMRIVAVSRKTARTGRSYFLLDFCGRPRNGSLYRRLQAYSLPSPTHDAALFFDTNTVTGCGREFSLVLRGRGRVPRSVPGCPIDFLPLRSLSRSLDVEPGSKTRDESGSAARHPFKLWPPAGSFVYSGIHYPRWSNGATFRRNL